MAGFTHLVYSFLSTNTNQKTPKALVDDDVRGFFGSLPSSTAYSDDYDVLVHGAVVICKSGKYDEEVAQSLVRGKYTIEFWRKFLRDDYTFCIDLNY